MREDDESGRNASGNLVGARSGNLASINERRGIALVLDRPTSRSACTDSCFAKFRERISPTVGESRSLTTWTFKMSLSAEMKMSTKSLIQIRRVESLNQYTQDVEERIRQRAYERFLQRGSENGNDLGDW